MTTSSYDSPYFELDIDQGTTFSRVVQLYDALDLIIDLTGATARMQFRRTPQSANVLVELRSSNGGLTVGTIDGNIQFTLTPTQTRALIDDCVFDCLVTFPSGVIIKAFSGIVSLGLTVTQ